MSETSKIFRRSTRPKESIQFHSSTSPRLAKKMMSKRCKHDSAALRIQKLKSCRRRFSSCLSLPPSCSKSLQARLYITLRGTKLKRTEKNATKCSIGGFLPPADMLQDFWQLLLSHQRRRKEPQSQRAQDTIHKDLGTFRCCNVKITIEDLSDALPHKSPWSVRDISSCGVDLGRRVQISSPLQGFTFERLPNNVSAQGVSALAALMYTATCSDAPVLHYRFKHLHTTQLVWTTKL